MGLFCISDQMAIDACVQVTKHKVQSTVFLHYINLFTHIEGGVIQEHTQEFVDTELITAPHTSYIEPVLKVPHSLTYLFVTYTGVILAFYKRGHSGSK